MQQTDVIIIGAGLAGLVGAIAAQQENARVTLIDRSFIGLGSNSAMAVGGFAGPGGGFTPEEYIKSVLQVGKYINHLPSVQLLAYESAGAFDFLRRLGVELENTDVHFYVKSPRPDKIRGALLMSRLAEHIKSSDKITTQAGFQAVELIIHNGVCHGVRGMDHKGNTVSLYAPALVLATGGAGAIYLRNDNQRSTMGQGYFLAAQAGLDLWDMEFVQFYPFVLDEPGQPSFVVYPPYPDGVRLLDSRGEDLLAKYGVGNVNDASKKKRDEMSAMLYKERLKGPVYLDFTRVGPRAWSETTLAILKKFKFDFQNKPARISAGAHFFMGGVRTDEAGRTELPGLFACGELVWGVHGANRRGGNALTDCLVRGKLAGQNAAAQALPHKPAPGEQKAAEQSFTPLASRKDARLKDLRTKIREIAWEKAGIIRSQSGLEQGLAKLAEVEKSLEQSGYTTPVECKLRQDLTAAACVLKAILTASLGRQESRGSFCREEYPAADNQNWRKNSRLAYDPASKTFKLSFHQAECPLESGA